MDTTHLTKQLTSKRLSADKVRLFATHIAEFEAKSGLRPIDVIVNGIPPFDDVPTVEFHVPKNDLAQIIQHLLGNSKFNPSIIINGIPAVDHYQIKVMGGP